MTWLLHQLDAWRHRLRVRSLGEDQALGPWGEDTAHRFLERHGMTVVARNFRTRSGLGEIDLIAVNGDATVFVEVKTRRSAEFGAPERAVDRAKRDRLVKAAREYMRRADRPWHAARFDVLSVVASHPPQVTHLRDVFELPAR